MSINTFLSENRVYEAPSAFKNNANINTQDTYTDAESDRLSFWNIQAKKLHWFQKWHTTLEWNRPYSKWFLGGKLNASSNCLDVHLKNAKNKTAIYGREKKAKSEPLPMKRSQNK